MKFYSQSHVYECVYYARSFTSPEANHMSLQRPVVHRLARLLPAVPQPPCGARRVV
jgi:hypothetical protein